MRMPFAAALVAALVSMMTSGGVQSAELLALKVLGFSPDGRHFGFIQYNGPGDSGEFFAEIYVIDAERDRFAAGIPFRVETDNDDAMRGRAEKAGSVLADAVKRSAKLIRNFKLSQPGVLLAQDADARTSEVESRSGAEAPLLGKPELIATHASLGRLEFRLTRKEFDWPATSRLGRHKNAEPCKTAVDWQKGAGFRLTLVRGRETIVLNDDKTIPASRFCASGYGIAAVHAFDRPDGKVTLAVVLGMSLRGFEGDDRRFLAVTRVLAK